MLVSVANRLRWRKLANASPRPALLTHMPKAALAPKYCSSPSSALSSAAVSQADAATSASATRSAHNTTMAKQPSVTSHGTTAGEGPKENGLIQGSAIARKTATERIDTPAPA